MTDTSPADQLHAAADLLRGQSTAAASRRTTPWSPASAGSVISPREGGYDYVTGYTIPEGAEIAAYIATMHPGVGLALAEWLEDASSGDDEGVVNPYATAVARQILGEGH